MGFHINAWNLLLIWKLQFILNSLNLIYIYMSSIKSMYLSCGNRYAFVRKPRIDVSFSKEAYSTASRSSKRALRIQMHVAVLISWNSSTVFSDINYFLRLAYVGMKVLSMCPLGNGMQVPKGIFNCKRRERKLHIAL